jgi:uncharacterized membrane protein
LKDWVHVAIVTVLRTGVIVSILVIIIGMTMTFVHHPEYFSSRPALGMLTSPKTHFPNTLADVIAGVRGARGQAIIMAGLLVLIATPVARVALSIVIFILARDRLYTAITSAVLVILLISFAVGLVAR